LKQPRLLVASTSNFLRAYAGVQYMSNALADHGFDVEVYAPIPRDMLAETTHCRFRVHSHYSGAAGRIPRLRIYSFIVRLVARALVQNCALLFTELRFLKQAAFIKRLRPQIPLIHYCQELLTPEEFPHYRGVWQYEALANIPDLVIDVEPHRASKRRERFGVVRKIMVLPNTLPMSEMPPRSPRGGLAKLAGGDLPVNLPILLYAGGTHEEMGVDIIAEALLGMSRPVFFLAFCHGPTRDNVNRLRRRFEGILGGDRCRVCDAVPRDQLRRCIYEADAALAYYPYSQSPSFNQLYCAPTKVFEYIAAGLPVVASGNPPLVDLIESRRLGVCAKDDGAMALRKAIEECLLLSENRSKHTKRATEIFAEELCFEKVSGPVLSEIKLLVAGSRGRGGR
jgi:glycosyltransferase involved in cell wall biosynthesis